MPSDKNRSWADKKCKNIVEKDYKLTVHEDTRFGDIFLMTPKQGGKTATLFKKCYSTNSEKEAFKRDALLVDRQRLNHKHMSQLHDWGSKKVSEWCSTHYEFWAYYDYPSSDCRSWTDSLGKKEGLKPITHKDLTFLMYQTLSVLDFLNLQKLNYEDVRPNHIGIRKFDKTDYELVDRLKFPLGAIEANHQHMQHNDNLYCSPLVFEAAVNKRKHCNDDRAKSDVFSLGMTVLALGLNTSVLEIYDIKGKKFDTHRLEELYSAFECQYAGENRLLCDMVEHCLKISESERPDAHGLLSRLEPYDHVAQFLLQGTDHVHEEVDVLVKHGDHLDLIREEVIVEKHRPTQSHVSNYPVQSSHHHHPVHDDGHRTHFAEQHRPTQSHVSHYPVQSTHHHAVHDDGPRAQFAEQHRPTQSHVSHYPTQSSHHHQPVHVEAPRTQHVEQLYSSHHMEPVRTHHDNKNENIVQSSVYRNEPRVSKSYADIEIKRDIVRMDPVVRNEELAPKTITHHVEAPKTVHHQTSHHVEAPKTVHHQAPHHVEAPKTVHQPHVAPVVRRVQAPVHHENPVQVNKRVSHKDGSHRGNVVRRSVEGGHGHTTVGNGHNEVLKTSHGDSHAVRRVEAPKEGAGVRRVEHGHKGSTTLTSGQGHDNKNVRRVSHANGAHGENVVKRVSHAKGGHGTTTTNPHAGSNVRRIEAPKEGATVRRVEAPKNDHIVRKA